MKIPVHTLLRLHLPCHFPADLGGGFVSCVTGADWKQLSLVRVPVCSQGSSGGFPHGGGSAFFAFLGAKLGSVPHVGGFVPPALLPHALKSTQA